MSLRTEGLAKKSNVREVLLTPIDGPTGSDAAKD